MMEFFTRIEPVQSVIHISKKQSIGETDLASDTSARTASEDIDGDGAKSGSGSGGGVFCYDEHTQHHPRTTSSMSCPFALMSNR